MNSSAQTTDPTERTGDIPEHGRIAIIPARGGSQRIPRKNLCQLYGRPLIWYSIEVARRSGAFSRIIVSTEDAEIADVSRAAGAEVLDRDPSLSQETSTTNAVLLNALAASHIRWCAGCRMCPVLEDRRSAQRRSRRLVEHSLASHCSFCV